MMGLLSVELALMTSLLVHVTADAPTAPVQVQPVPVAAEATVMPVGRVSTMVTTPEEAKDPILPGVMVK